MWFKDKKVLINGISGFIGSNLGRALVAQGAKIYSIDNFSYINREMMERKLGDILERVTIIEGDVSDKENWDKLPRDIEFIFHFAAPSSIVLFKNYPRKCYDETVRGLHHALDYAKENGVKKLIYPSSGSVYSGNAMPHHEEIYPFPRNLYAASKIACEALARSYADFVPSVGVRIFVGYGPGEEWKEDFGSAPFLFLRDLMQGKSPEIWGDGNQTRDLIYIDDIVKAVLQLAEIEYTGIINLGTGESISFKDLVEMAKNHLNSNVEPAFVPKKDKNYLEHIKADVSRSREILDFTPTPVEEGLVKFINHLKASS